MDRGRFLIGFFIIVAFIIYQHELVHKQIMIYDGCDNVKIGFHFPSPYTRCLDNMYSPSETAQLSHNINEIISYTIINTMLLLFLLNKISKED